MKKAILALCAALGLGTLSHALPQNMRGVVTFASHYRFDEGVNAQNEQCYSFRVHQAVLYTSIGPNISFSIYSGQGEMMSIIANFSININGLSVYDSKLALYDGWFCSIGYNDPTDYISMEYDADWYVASVLSEFSTVYGYEWYIPVPLYHSTTPYEGMFHFPW